MFIRRPPAPNQHEKEMNKAMFTLKRKATGDPNERPSKFIYKTVAFF